MEWARILAYITGTVDHELLLRNEYLAAENRILKAQLKGRLRLSDGPSTRLHRLLARIALTKTRMKIPNQIEVFSLHLEP
jgi:putative transposase